MPLPPLGALGQLRDLFPDPAVRLTSGPQDVPYRPSPNIQDALPMQTRVSPADEARASAAGLLSGASQNGQKDGFSDMLLRAGAQGAGPLSGIFSALGAALAGKDPDFAAAVAQEGFRRLHQQVQADQAFAIQKREARLRTLRQAVSVAAAAKVPRKRLEAMVDQLLLESGIRVDEPSRELLVNRPEVRNMIWPKDGARPSIEEQQAFMGFMEEEGLDPSSSLALTMATNRLVEASAPPAAQDKPGQIIPYEEAVQSLVAQSKGSITAEEAIAMLPGKELGGIDRTLLNQIAERVVDQGKESPLGSAIAEQFASAMGLPELAGPLSRIPTNQVGPVVSQLRQAFSRDTDQFIEQTTNQVLEQGRPLSEGQRMRLERVYQEDARRSLSAISSTLEFLEVSGLDEDSPESQVLRGAIAQMQSAISKIPDILRFSEQLASTYSIDELEGMIGDLYTEQEATFGQ